MDPVVTVDTDAVTVEPGGQASVTVRVRNLSSIVEGFHLDVLGDAAGWAQVLPGRLEVLPQGEAQATILFAPPAGGTTRAGQVPFAVRAVSQVDPSSSAVAEGDLQVGGVSLSQAKISPATARGRWSAKYRLEFSNWGNSPVRLKLEASDPDEALGFLVTPPTLDLPLGATSTARLKVRARKPFFRGTPMRRAFRVVGRPLEPGALVPAPGPAPQPYGHDPSQPGVDGAFEQKAIVGRGIVPLAVLALVAAGTIGYLTSRPGADPEDESVAPPPPQELTAEPLSSSSVRLRWQPGDRVDSYTVFVVDPATKEDFQPTASTTIEDIPGTQGQYDVPDLAPATEHCFQVAAVRGDATSARAPVQCVTTSAAPAPGSPPTPTDVAVARTPDGKVRVSWSDASEGQANHVILRGTTNVTTVPAPAEEGTVDAVAGEECYRVQAVKDDLTSEPSEEVCLETLPEGSGGAPGDPAPTLGVIAVSRDKGLAIIADPGSAQIMADKLAALQQRGLEVGVLRTDDYPGITPAVASPAYLAYFSPFDSAEAAQRFCADIGETCEIYTPGAPRAGATVPELPPPAASQPAATTTTTATP